MITKTITEYEMEDYDNFEKNLTDEEAANILEYINRGWVPDYNYTGSESDYENFKMHIAMYKAIDKLRGK